MRNRLLDLSEIAYLLKINPQTLKGWVQDGLVPAVKVGHEYRFVPKVLREWITRNSLSYADFLQSVDGSSRWSGQQARNVLKAIRRLR